MRRRLLRSGGKLLLAVAAIPVFAVASTVSVAAEPVVNPMYYGLFQNPAASVPPPVYPAQPQNITWPANAYTPPAAAPYAAPAPLYATPAAVYAAQGVPAVTYVNPLASAPPAQPAAGSYLYPNPATLAHNAGGIPGGGVPAAVGAFSGGSAVPPYQAVYNQGLSAASGDPYASVGGFVDYQSYLNQQSEASPIAGVTPAALAGSDPFASTATIAPTITPEHIPAAITTEPSPIVPEEAFSAPPPPASAAKPADESAAAAPLHLALPPDLPESPKSTLAEPEKSAAVTKPTEKPEAEKKSAMPPAAASAAPTPDRSENPAPAPTPVLEKKNSRENLAAGDDAAAPQPSESPAAEDDAAAEDAPPPSSPKPLPPAGAPSTAAAAAAAVVSGAAASGEAPVAGIAVNVHQPEDEAEEILAVPDNMPDPETPAESLDDETDADSHFTQGKPQLQFPVPLPPPQELAPRKEETPQPSRPENPAPNQPPAATPDPAAAAPAVSAVPAAATPVAYHPASESAYPSSVPAYPAPEPVYTLPDPMLNASASQPASEDYNFNIPTLTPDSSPTVGLAELGSTRALDGTPLPPPPLPELPATKPEPALPPPDIALVRAGFNRLKTYCEEESLGSAAEVFARMPDFGKDEEINRLRANAANLLILALCRGDNLAAARRIYESVPNEPAGYDATVAKARAIINLTTYYVRAERWNDAYAVLMDIGKIAHRSALNNELFRLMARMIPYLDNAEETGKAQTVFELLLREINSPAAAALFAENAPGIFKYYLHYVDKTESPPRRRKRLDFLEFAFTELEKFSANPDMADTRKKLGEAIAERYAGDPERAAKFYLE